jgi:prefoldin subunit 5
VTGRIGLPLACGLLLAVVGLAVSGAVAAESTEPSVELLRERLATLEERVEVRRQRARRFAREGAERIEALAGERRALAGRLLEADTARIELAEEVARLERRHAQVAEARERVQKALRTARDAGRAGGEKLEIHLRETPGQCHGRNIPELPNSGSSRRAAE